MTEILDLYQVQVGAESSDAWGTAVAQTAKLMGITDISIDPQVDSKNFADKRGTLVPADEVDIVRVGGSASIKGIALYEDMPYWMDMLFGTDSSPTYDSTAETYLYEYDSPKASYDSDLTDPRIMTIAQGKEAGDDESLAGATLTTFTLSGETGGELSFDANLIGKEVAADSMDTCTDRAVHVVMGDHVTLYIDPASDAIGTTLTSDVFFSFTLAIDTGRALVYHMGSLTPTGYRDKKWAGTLSLILECDAATKAYLTAILAASTTLEKAVRIVCTDTAARVITIDFWGTVLEAPSLYPETDGVKSLNLVFTGKSNTTSNEWLEISVLNAVAAMP